MACAPKSTRDKMKEKMLAYVTANKTKKKGK